MPIDKLVLETKNLKASSEANALAIDTIGAIAALIPRGVSS